MASIYGKRYTIKYNKTHYAHPVFPNVGYCLTKISHPKLVTKNGKNVTCVKCNRILNNRG